jgi:hypothetical protein
MINAARRKVAIRTNSPTLLGSLAIIAYYTTIEVANYLGLTYEEFCDLPGLRESRNPEGSTNVSIDTSGNTIYATVIPAKNNTRMLKP